MMRDLLDFTNMESIFNAPNEQFEALGETRAIHERKHIFIDNGADVLAIAHMDSVNLLPHFYPLTIDKKDIVLSSRCDDRLGVYILIDLLPRLGCKYDILLTDFEEISASTGKDFVPVKQYNWMFQFDRRLDDAVTYMYNNLGWKDALKTKLDVGHGSASDISKMEHLKCSGVNVGAGYNNEHDHFAYFYVDMMCEQVGKFVEFFEEYKDTYFAHEKHVPANSGHYYPPANQTTYLPATSTYAGYTCDCCFRKFRLVELNEINVGDTPERWCDECIDSQGMNKCEACLTYTDSTLAVNVGGTIEFWCFDCYDTANPQLDSDMYETAPLNCIICEQLLETCPSSFFMGICKDCEDDAVECDGCGAWIHYTKPACDKCLGKEVIDAEPIDDDTTEQDASRTDGTCSE